MGAPMVVSKKVISQSDQHSDVPSGDTNSSAATIAEDSAHNHHHHHHHHHQATSTSSSANRQSSTTPNANANTKSNTLTNQPPQAIHHQYQHQYYHHQQQQRRYFSPNIATNSHHQSFYQPHQQQSVQFPHHQFGPPHLVYPAPTSNTAHIFFDGHPQPAYNHLAAQLYSHDPAPSSLVAHTLHQASGSHAQVTLHPASAASYYVPLGPPAASYTAAHTSLARATTTAHQHQYSVLLAGIPSGVSGPPLHPYQYSNFINGNINFNAPQEQLHQPDQTARSAASPNPDTPASPSSSSVDTDAAPDKQQDDDSSANSDNEPPATKDPASPTITAHAYDSAIGTAAGSWLPAGYQLLVQPSTYYLRHADAVAASAATASSAGLLLMPAYPLFHQANYGAAPMANFSMQQPYHQQNSLDAEYHHHLYTQPMMQASTHQPAIYMPPEFGQPKAGLNLVTLLPIDAQPAETRQAYGMDKVWQDEFECLFSQFISSSVLWTLVEVETNPSLRDSDKIIAYSGRYIIRAGNGECPPSGGDICCAGCEFSAPTVEHDEGTTDHNAETTGISATVEIGESSLDRNESPEIVDRANEVSGSESEDSGEADLKSVETESDPENREAESPSMTDNQVNDEMPLEPEAKVGPDEGGERSAGDCTSACSGGAQEQGKTAAAAAEIESDCDSGAQVNSTRVSSSGGSSRDSSSSGSSSSGSHSDEPVTSAPTETNPETANCCPTEEAGTESRPAGGQPAGGRGQRREFLKRFRMFIDSAKVRFCCDHCGHGWTSMKGRVVFWYELFEVVDMPQQHLGLNGAKMIGFCAYKLFGQQCDVCKIENRFERPMWYPEEVTKVLNNLYNKIGQVYFGFKMPAIDKQRRAGKPKTSHNSSLCQACHDGVCTDRK